MAMPTKSTALLTNARKQKVIVEYRETGREWWVLFDDGHVEVFDSAAYALAAIKRLARKRNLDVTLTTVEWRDVPDGWTPPS